MTTDGIPAQMPEKLREILAEDGWEPDAREIMLPGEQGWRSRGSGEYRHTTVHVRTWTDGRIWYYADSTWLGCGIDHEWFRAVELCRRIELALAAGDGAGEEKG